MKLSLVCFPWNLLQQLMLEAQHTEHLLSAASVQVISVRMCHWAWSVGSLDLRNRSVFSSSSCSGRTSHFEVGP